MNLAALREQSMDRSRFPIDEWALTETSYHEEDLGLTESLFTVANGYLGMRANPEEGRDAHAHGTFINGFHETWPIRHAENAFGFARTGQTIVNVPDVKVMKIYVDDEPLNLGTADLERYERVLDFASGELRRNLIWRTPSGKRVRVDTRRIVSMTERHLAVLSVEVEMLSGSAPIVISSQILNRQDGEDEYHVPEAAMGEGMDPRKASRFTGRVLQPQRHSIENGRMLLGYRCTNSQMTLAVAAEHALITENSYEVVTRCSEDLAKMAFRVDAQEGVAVRLDKFCTYHTSRGVPVRELVDRCERTLDRASRQGADRLRADQKQWYADFWDTADVIVADQPEVQQAIRYNLFQLAQASGRADREGVAAKGISGSGYEGHYFWDTEVYVAPFLTYTQPQLARNVLHFRFRMLPAARRRARELAETGALFPWRTINGEEASAYYAAGTAQFHINADIAYALSKYVDATGDTEFLIRNGIDILVETARMWAGLGFWRSNGEKSFHIHGVTGPDEYTTVVNNNLFTNVMARYNLERAAAAVDLIRDLDATAYQQMVERLQLQALEVDEWRRCAAGMTVPYETELGIHPQDEHFLDREVWDLTHTPAELRPLLMHYHPLVIYRFQVLKQADVVLAMLLQGDRFTLEEKRANFEYYDPITTGDSTLSAVVQSIIAAEVGHQEAALKYFRACLHVDLMDLHRNTVDGLHIASAGGVWSALVFGFGGMRDHGGRLSFDPRLPTSWPSLSFAVRWRGARLRVRLTAGALELAAEQVDETGADCEVPVLVRGTPYLVRPGEPVTVPLTDQGPMLTSGLGSTPATGARRADGTKITAGVPEPSAITNPVETLGPVYDRTHD
ncbi:glycoside hydrolase family 65 protein [Nocardioides limicola]|uniref:glycoside hydrolase family 65 protein n=1 Tax=Nocardioides limicola TaxID=2803368 RepID=UPI001EEFEE6D|nr:glycosyl hydrolase family 65 protein [Nocardioides sp. DJM-14]